ncbi:MAGUK p55 subfamily member 6 [Armadillidium vulgare]|nr:MAGUK p55 subfamily member 6 [Armadillidium vulgare]
MLKKLKFKCKSTPNLCSKKKESKSRFYRPIETFHKPTYVTIYRKPSDSQNTRVPEPLTSGALAIVRQLRDLSESSTSAHAQALTDILYRPHLLALLSTHDTIAKKRLFPRHYWLKSSKNAPVENCINSGHENEVFMPEENGYQVTTMEELHHEISKTTDSVHLKVLPAVKDNLTPNQVTSSLHPDATRTIISKRKRKMMFSTKESVEYDKAELILYEEVARMPPFMRKTLVLMGSHGVGKRTLKSRIVASDPSRFGGVIPHTSRPMREMEEDGKAYHFTTREAMEADIRNHAYLEYGELNGNLYGTKLESILSVIRSGKMCVLDPSPTSLKYLRNSSDFLPYVIFLAAPGLDELKNLNTANRYIGSSSKSLTEEDYKKAIEESAKMQRMYQKYFDLVIENNDLNDTYNIIIENIDKLATEPQWVPVTWVY